LLRTLCNKTPNSTKEKLQELHLYQLFWRMGYLFSPVLKRRGQLTLRGHDANLMLPVFKILKTRLMADMTRGQDINAILSCCTKSFPNPPVTVD
jgi:hypothetical protein